MIRDEWPTAALWSLGGDPARLPPRTRAYAVGHLAKRAAMGTARRLFGPDQVPRCLHGHGDEDEEGAGVAHDPRHPHAFFLADVPADGYSGTGAIERVLTVAPGGLDRAALAALVMCERLYDGPRSEWPVRCVWVGPMADAPSRLVACARVWVSATPWVCPLHTKPGRGIDTLLVRDLTGRGWPVPERVEPLPAVPGAAGRMLARHDFTLHLERRTGRPRPDSAGSLWRLTFPHPVQGPLIAGWDCHLGLGLFVPED